MQFSPRSRRMRSDLPTIAASFDCGSRTTATLRSGCSQLTLNAPNSNLFFHINLDHPAEPAEGLQGAALAADAFERLEGEALAHHIR